MSATSGWYPDPGGGQGLYRFWDGRAWSAATTTDPASAPPPQGLVNPGSAAGTAGATAHANYGQGAYGQGSSRQSAYGQGSSAHGSSAQGSSGQGAYGQGPYGQGSSGQGPYGQGSSGQGPYGQAPGQNAYGQSAYGQGASGQPGSSPYASLTKKRSGLGWWIGAGALLLVIVVVAVFAISRATSGDVAGGGASGQDSSNPCPPERSDGPSPTAPATDGRVHGGPVSYPEFGPPWSAPKGETRVPFGVNVLSQEVLDQADYDGQGQNHDWVASVLVGELQAGDGFFTPQQGSQIVVRCVLGRFYGDNAVNSDVVVNKATTIDGHEAWLVESKLTFDIAGLNTKGERLIVAIVQAGTDRSGLFYASIPDTTPELLQPARDALSQLKVDG